jgi:hypothetical protein
LLYLGLGLSYNTVILFAIKEPIYKIIALTGYTETTIKKLKKKTIDYRYNPEISVICKLQTAENTFCSGRPKTSQVVV